MAYSKARRLSQLLGSDGSIPAGKIPADSIDGSKIADNSIDSEHYADGSIDTAHIATDQITNALIPDNAIDSEHYTDGSIDTAHIAADQITSALIADDQIDSEHIVDGSIDLAHMSVNSIDSDQYVDGSIDLIHMSANSIDSDQYVDGSIDTAHIADDQITAAKLANTAVTAAAYGSSTAIPTFTVDAQGRLTAASTAALSTAFTLAADSGSNDTFNTSETLTFAGTTNEINTTVSNNQIQIGLPDNVTISGNLTVSGDTTTVNTSTLAVEDPLVALATGNNAADAVDIGLYGLYDTSGSLDLYGGLFRDASDSGKWNLFKDLQAVPTTTVNKSGTGYAVGTLIANLEGNVTGNVTGNTSGTALTVTQAAQTAITSLGTLTALTVSGNATVGGTLGVTGDATIAGTTKLDGGNGYFRDGVGNSFSSGWDANTDDHSTWINFEGYQGGTTRFRDLRIGTGKQASFVHFDGSAAAVNISGTLGVTGALTGTSATFTPSSGENFVITRDSGGPYIGASSNHSLRIITNNATRMHITSAGYVGIGVTPTHHFNLQGTGAVEARFRSTDGDMSLQISSDADETHDSELNFMSGTSGRGSIVYDHHTTAATQKMLFKTGDLGVTAMTITGDGNVGIGLDPTGYAKLTVNGTGTLIGMRASSGAGRIGWYEGGAGRFYMESLNGTDGIRFLDGDGSSERMRIDHNGNVGIGTAAPYSGAKLTVQTDQSDAYSATGFNSGSLLRIVSVNANTNYSSIAFSNVGGNYEHFIGAVQTSANTADIVFQGYDRAASAYKEYLRITDGGNVGIGVAPNTSRLKVEQSVSGEWAMNIKHASTGVNYGLSIETSAGATNDVGALQVYTPSGGGLIFTNRGRLGIGTSAPGHALDLLTSSGNTVVNIKSTTAGDPELQFDSAASSRNGVIRFLDQGAAAGKIIYAHNGDTMSFHRANEGTPSLMLKGGNVCIGHTAADNGILSIAANKGSAGSLWSQVGPNNNASLIIQNLSAVDNTNAVLYFANDAGVQAAINARFVNHSTDETELRFSTHNGSSGAERMVLDGDGNLGLGTMSPFSTTKLHLKTAHGVPAATGQTQGLAALTLEPQPDIRLDIGSNYYWGSGVWFQTGNVTDLSARYAIHLNPKNGASAANGGAVSIASQGITPSASQAGFMFSGDQFYTSAGGVTSANYQVRFYNGNGLVGSIVTSGSATAFNTSSDYRLKENVDYTWDATTRLKQLKPARFNWIADDTNTLVDGFLAHEVSSIVPEAITGEKDGMSEPVLWKEEDNIPDGKSAGDVRTASEPEYQAVDQSKLVPLLVKAIQELSAELDAAKARITTLEG